MKYLQISSYCQILSPGEKVRVKKRLIVEQVAGESIYKIVQGPFVIKKIPNRFQGLPIELGDQVWVEGEVEKVSAKQMRPTSTELFLQTNGKKAPENTPSGESKRGERLTSIYGCEITLSNPSIVAIHRKEGSVFYPIFRLLEVLNDLRSLFLQRFMRYFPEPHGSLAYGVLFGDTPQLADKYYQLFIRVGILHVVAASGYNISIIMVVLSQVLLRVVRSKRLILVISAIAIIFYIFMAGISPSIIRAGIMGLIAVSAQIFGRVYSANRALMLTLLLMLFFDPYVIFSASFQLSVSATVGILMILPLLRVHQTIPSTKKPSTLYTAVQAELGDAFLTTVSASILTMPIILYRFGQLSVVALVANTTLLWLIPLLMFCATLFLVGSFMVPWASVLFAAPAWAVAHLFLMGVNFFDRFPWASVEFSQVPITVPLIWFIVVLLWGRRRAKNVARS